MASIALFASACATDSRTLYSVERNLAVNQPERALKSLEKENKRWARRDRVLYLLNKAMLLRIDGDFAASNKAFEQAKQRVDKLYGVSVSEQIGSFIVNDSTRHYVGEQFEQVLVHVYKALNYLEMDQLDAARVEALQVDLKFRQLSKKIEKKKYTEDAFARYLSGLIYEEHREWSDAMIEYRKAYDAYREYRRQYGVGVPRVLQRDLLRLADNLGLLEELERYKREFSVEYWHNVEQLQSHGELVFVLHNGLAPVKRERSMLMTVPGTYTLVRISLPYYESRYVPAVGARLRVGGETLPLELVEDVGAIAIKTLKRKMPSIRAKAISRASAKAAVAYELKDRDHWLLGTLVEMAGLMSEHADTRSWLTLPHNIYLARVPLEPGTYTVKLELLDRRGDVIGEYEFPDVTIERERKTFLSHHWINRMHLLFQR